MEDKKYTPKTIYCPRCKRKAFVYDGRGTIDIAKKCRCCGRLVVYQIAADKTLSMKVPPREHISGVRFW